MNIVVPMSGRSTGFLRSKFRRPRYDIEINGITVLERSLRGLGDANYYFICLSDLNDRFDLQRRILRSFKNAKVLLADAPGSGQASTALWAEKYVSNDDPLLIISPMQIINWNPDMFFAFCENTKADASVVVTNDIVVGREMFYAKVDFKRGVVGAISDTNCGGWMFDCGVYYFKYGWYFFRWCKEMMAREGVSKSEYWVAPCMNDGIIEGRTVRPYFVNSSAALLKAENIRQFCEDLPEWAKP